MTNKYGKGTGDLHDSQMGELHDVETEAPMNDRTERYGIALLDIYEMIASCPDAPQEPDSLIQMVKVRAMQALSTPPEPEIGG